jgi:hypothetical protein
METIELTQEEIAILMADVSKGGPWSESSYRILEFLGHDPLNPSDGEDFYDVLSSL